MPFYGLEVAKQTEHKHSACWEKLHVNGVVAQPRAALEPSQRDKHNRLRLELDQTHIDVYTVQ